MTAIFLKAVRDRGLSMAIAAGVVALWLAVAMGIYRDIDLSIYTELPQAMRELMGIPAQADAAVLAYNVMLEFAAALAIAGVAVSLGAAAIAGEEERGTIGLLLANPQSRSRVLVAKLASMLVLVVAGAGAVFVAALIAPRPYGIEIGNVRLVAMLAHLGANAILHGMIAFAIGAWTGNRRLSGSTAAAIIAVSYVAVGTLSLVPALRGLVKIFPWYYFAGSDPLVNGVAWGHLSIQLGGAALLAALAVIGVNRRDLHGPRISPSLLQRLKKRLGSSESETGAIAVSSIAAKTASEHRTLLLATAALMFSVMGLLMGPMYRSIESEIAGVADDFPDVVLAIAGDGDLSTPEGWFQVETFSLMAPIAVIVVSVAIAVHSVSGEEARGTLGLLLANPVRRSRIIFQAAAAMVGYAAVVGVATIAGVAGANAISSLHMDYKGIVAAGLMATLLGLVFGAVALVLAAATGHSRVAIYGAVAAALCSHLLDVFLALSDSVASWARLTPHYYYLRSDPLNNGFAGSHVVVLGILVALLIGLAAWLFDHRDLRLR